MKAVKSGSRLYEVVWTERLTLAEKKIKETLARSEQAQARAKKVVMEAKLLKRNRTA